MTNKICMIFNFKKLFKNYRRGGNSSGAFLEELEGAFWEMGRFKRERIESLSVIFQDSELGLFLEEVLEP